MIYNVIICSFIHFSSIKALLFNMKSLNVLHEFIKRDIISQMVRLQLQLKTIVVLKGSLTWKRHQ